MHRSIRSRPLSLSSALCLGLALQLSLPAASAHAAPATREDRAASKLVFQRAQEDYAAGRYSVALAGYAEAHRLYPLPAFIFNMAQCERLLDRPEEALALYRRYLTEEPKAKNRATVEGLISELETTLAARRPKEPVNLVPATPTEPPAAELAAITSTPAAAPAPLHHQWWFWTGVAVVVGGVATGVALASGGPSLPPTSLGDVVLR